MNTLLKSFLGILAAVLVVASGAPLHADGPASSKPVAPVVALPPGKLAYTVTLPAVVDPDLVGQHVDVYERRVTNDSRIEDYNLVLSNVLVLSRAEPLEASESPKQATLALDAKEMKHLQKYERPGHDIVLRAHTIPTATPPAH